jgi:N-acetylglucosaminyldiphosphoundecaprenol N-acetyl-beta-D-mannosaminyltransferase
MAEAVDLIDGFVREGTPHVVITTNVDHLMLLQRDAAFRGVYGRAELVTCDSIPLRWACSFLGRPVKERVAGADLFYTLSERAAAKGYRVFYLGAAPGVAEKAARAMQTRYPGLTVAGAYAPPVMALDQLVADEETYRRVMDARPHILFVAFGAPKQELWLEAMRARLGVPVGIGVGAAFDFAAGTIKRAPRWLQALGLEWLHRLFQEPKRLWRRYLLVDTRFVFYLLQERFRRKNPPPPLEK